MIDYLELFVAVLVGIIIFIFPLLILELIKIKREVERLRHIEEYFRVDKEVEEPEDEENDVQLFYG